MTRGLQSRLTAGRGHSMCKTQRHKGKSSHVQGVMDEESKVTSPSGELRAECYVSFTHMTILLFHRQRVRAEMPGHTRHPASAHKEFTGCLERNLSCHPGLGSWWQGGVLNGNYR